MSQWLPRAALVIACAVLAAVLLLMHRVAPDHAGDEAVLAAARALALHDAALQRDVLEARAGLLDNYDPLVRDMAGIRLALKTLRDAGLPDEPADRRALDAIIDARDQALEDFKSDNALLRNSLRYLTTVIAGADAPGRGEERWRLSGELGRFANALLVFVFDPDTDAMRQVNRLLDRLGALMAPGADGADDLRHLVAHGRLIVTMLPKVDAVLIRLTELPVAEHAQRLEMAWMERRARGQAIRQVGLFVAYGAAATICVALGWIVYRIWARGRVLAERSRALEDNLRLHGLVTEVSAGVAVARQREDLDHAISRVIGRLGDFRGMERAYVVLVDRDGEPAAVSHWWDRPGPVSSEVSRQGIPALLRTPEIRAMMTGQHYVAISSAAAMPPGPARTALDRLGISAMLCVPIQAAGRPIGFLGFTAPRGGTGWTDADIGLVATVGEVVANAVDRERAETERKELQTRLHHAEKLEALGTLAGGIAHDFNNILGAILGHGEMAAETLGSASPASRHVREVIAAGERAAALVRNILLFGRAADTSPGVTRVQPEMAEAIASLRVSLPAGIEIQDRLDAPGVAVSGDPARLHQIVMNLCVNGAQAMGGVGRLSVSLDTLSFDRGQTFSNGGLPAGRYARLRVVDTGCGMDAATIARIFDPFFTTKPAGSGTGLGLAIVHGIVTEAGGAIDVQSQPGQGSCFTVYLPQVEAGRGPAGSAEAPVMPGQGETIMIVDDDERLLRLGEEMLAALGYEPVGFDAAPDALAALRRAPDRFDLVLSDVVMPGMDGVALAAAIHEIRPDLPVLLMTGFGNVAVGAAAGMATEHPALRKPLRKADIAAAIAPLLKTARSGDGV